MTTPFLSAPIFSWPAAPSGLLYTYIAGTTNNKVTYSDAAGTVPNTNPVQLDTTGSATVRLDTGAYDFVLKDQTGTTTIWSALTYSQQFLTAAQIGALIYPVQTVETTASVVPSNLQFAPLDPRRYATAANWSAVYAAVSALSDTDWPFYRGDHAQHPSQTNAILGFASYDDSQLTGTIGYRCTAMGALTMAANKSSVSAGGSNCSFGYATLETNVEGSGNSCFGALSLQSLNGVSSSHNNAFGYRSLTLLVNGTQNEVFGFQGINSLTTGNNNHAFGENVLQAMTVGFGNHHFGYQAGFNKGIGDFSHAFGYQALTSESQGTITAITKAASAVVTINTVSISNPFTVGTPVSFEGVSGMTEINGVLTGAVSAIGGVSGAWTVTVSINSSGFSTFTSGGAIFPLGNSAFGYQTAASLNCAGANTVMGWQAGNGAGNPLDFGNTLFGYQAGFKGSLGATLNVAIGYQALINNITGSSNVAIGQQSATNINGGVSNVCIGDNSGQAITNVNGNVCIGSTTGVNLNGANNTNVGFNAGSQGSAQTFTDAHCFGANSAAIASHSVTLGSASITVLRCQQTTITALSDIRFKKNVAPLEIPDGFLDEVQIVVYEWIEEGMAQGPQVGVIAQQLDALQEKYGLQWLGLVNKDNPERWEATPGKLLFPLIQRVQRQEARLKAIEAKLGL